MSRDVVKQELLAKLKQEHCFWSYNENLIKDIPDDMLIEKTLLHLDLEEINQLFLIYPFKKIKQVWLDYLVPQAEYLYTLNRFCMVLFQGKEARCLYKVYGYPPS